MAQLIPAPCLLPRSLALAAALLLSACGGGGGEATPQDVTGDDVTAVVAAYPASGTAPLTANLDGSGSWALDGSALTYDWDLDGDGVFETPDGAVTQSHTWAEAGTYTVALRVFDAGGKFAVDTVEIVVSAAGGGGADNGVDPVAQLSAWPSTGAAPLEVTLDGSGCWAQDGGALTFAYDFEGDGTYDLETGESEAVHTYTQAGAYRPAIRVTDADGRTATASEQVTVAAGGGGSGGSNDPVAQLSAWPSTGAAPLEVTLDGAGCWAQDGGALTFEYDFEGDGTYDLETTETQVTYTYTEGAYQPTIRVTDTDGRTASASQRITVAAETGTGGGATEQGPIAVLLATPVYGAPPLAVELDASSSVALGAALAGYDWDLDGDGEFELIDAGPTQAVTYQEAGLFYVNVRVNDADGLSGTGQAAIVVSASL